MKWTLFKQLFQKGIHFDEGDEVVLNNSAPPDIKKCLGTGINIVEEMKWAENLSYVDQFLKIHNVWYYNTIFQRP